MYNTVDKVEISAAAQLLHTLDQRGLVLVNKQQHEESIAARYYLARLVPILNRVLDATKSEEFHAAFQGLRNVREAGWFDGISTNE